MGLPRTLKDMMLFNEGLAYLGEAGSVTLPTLTRKMEEWRGAGMNAPVKMDMGMEAMELEAAGARVDLPKDDLAYPEELVAALEDDPDLQTAFDALTPGRRRGYVLHFSQPKQPATRQSRIAKSRDRILAGKGMHDR